MFRKAHLRLFAIITAILLAVFIAVLGSINVIMRKVTQQQSLETLRHVAADIEYDPKTSTFTYNRGFGKRPYDDQPPFKPPVTTTGAVSATTTSTENSKTETTTTTAETTAALSVTTSAQAQTHLQTQTTASPKTETVTTKLPVTEPPTGGYGEPPMGHHGDHGRPDEPFYDPEYPDQEDPPREEPTFAPQYPGRREYQEVRNLSFSGASGTVLSNTVLPVYSAPGDQPMPDTEKKEPVPKSLESMNFFIIMADKEGEYLASMNNDDLTEETAQSYISTALKNKDNTGMLGSLQYYRQEKTNGTLIVLTDKSADQNMLRRLTRTTMLIGAMSFLLLSAAAFFISKKIMQPLKTAFDKQKQFISDASHELKTPLTVISANADVLSGEIGENKWLNYIRSQTDRMNVLVNDLLNLTRLENNTGDFIRTDFDLSKAIINTALPFECQAFESNKTFQVNVEEGITLNGSERHIKQMAAIFIDNALKYSNDGGTVIVTLKKQGDKKLFSVYNTGEGVKNSEKDKIFERFYRSDDSRSRATGGYGLGLAIARSIIDRHKFKITVDNEEGKSIRFTVIM